MWAVLFIYLFIYYVIYYVNFSKVGAIMATFVHEQLFLDHPGKVAASLPEDEEIS